MDVVASQILDATTRLRDTLAIVEGLLAETRFSPSEQTRYHLGEAGRAIHHALTALAECPGNRRG